jgi:hypothetical protein
LDDPGVLADIDTPADVERLAPGCGTPLPQRASKTSRT